MKTGLLTLFMGLALSLSLSSCRAQATDSDAATQRTSKNIQHVKYFSTVESYLSCSVIFKQGETAGIRVVGEEDQIDRLQFSFTGEKLTISEKESYLPLRGRDLDGVTIYLQSPDLTGVTLYGSGDFSVPSSLNTDALEVGLMGSGNIEFSSVVCDDIALKLFGSGNVDCDKVNCVRADLSVSGSGNMDVDLVNAEQTNANLIGSGNLEVEFSRCGSVNCNLTGSGNIELSGDVARLTKRVAGSGELDVEDLRVGRSARQ